MTHVGELAPTVYAIIVNFNRWQDTLECLESLMRSDYPALRVLVCDNASEDGSVEKIAAWARGDLPAPVPRDSRLSHLGVPPVRKPVSVAICADVQRLMSEDALVESAKLLVIQCGSNLGFAGANNVALRYVLRREPNAYALLLNNDAVIAPHALPAMVEQAERSPRMGAIGATILEYHQPDRVEMLAGARFSHLHGMVTLINAGAARDERRPERVPMDFIAGCCLLVSRSAIESVGLMDERYFLYGEDTDWCLRMKKQNLGLAYCPSAEIWHKGGGSVVHRSALHDYYAVRGTLMVVHKHFPLSLPIALSHAVLRFILPKLLRGEWQRLRAAARGYRDFVRYALRATNEQPA
jgi:GT2 family glycosyltransferase